MSNEIISPVEEAPILKPDALTEEAPVVEPPPVELFTAEQLAERLAERDAEWSERLNAKDSEVAQLRSLNDASTIERALTDACHAGGAYNMEQVLPLLRPFTSVIDGKPVVQIEGFQLSPDEAISWMYHQTERYGNLFKSRIVSGIGGHSDPGGTRGSHRLDVKNMSAGEYRAVRAENPGLLGLRGDN